MNETPIAPQSPAASTDTRQIVRPVANTLEASDAFLIEVELPGVSKDNIEIRVADGSLEVAGSPERRHAQPVVGETSDIRFHRSFQVSDAVDTSNVTASLTDGVLLLRLPKAERAKPRQIHVQ